jgi:glycosyltransferase involved in cell wall biosynthesis
MTNNLSRNYEKTRIAYVFNQSFFLGGGEISLSELIRSINTIKFDPIVIVPERGEIERQFTEREIKVFQTPFPPLKHILLGGPVFAIFKLAKTLRNCKVDIIHANGSRACFYAGLVGRMLGIPVIWHVRENIQDFFLYDGLLGLLAKVIICVSRNVRHKRFGRFGRKIKNKIVVIYNGVDTSRFQRKQQYRQAIRKELSMNRKDILFGIIGNILPLKGQDFLLRGLAKAKENKPDLLAKVLVMGRTLDSSFKERLHRLVLAKNLDTNVIFRNYSEKIIEIFPALDVFVLPSKREGFSRSLLEAMSESLPVLGSKISEIEEAVPNEQYGLLVDFNDVKKMASAIIKLSENDKLRKNMGQRNRRRAVQYFDLKTHARLVETIYTTTVPRIHKAKTQPSWSTP